MKRIPLDTYFVPKNPFVTKVNLKLLYNVLKLITVISVTFDYIDQLSHVLSLEIEKVKISQSNDLKAINERLFYSVLLWRDFQIFHQNNKIKNK